MMSVLSQNIPSPKVRDEMARTHRLYLADEITAQGFGEFYKPAEQRLNQLVAELPKLEGMRQSDAFRLPISAENSEEKFFYVFLAGILNRATFVGKDAVRNADSQPHVSGRDFVRRIRLPSRPAPRGDLFAIARSPDHFDDSGDGVFERIRV
jgi:hypothetical protein